LETAITVTLETAFPLEPIPIIRNILKSLPKILDVGPTVITPKSLEIFT